MKPLLLIFGLLLSLQSMANSCLSSASNSELLSEVQRRMSGGGGGGGTDASAIVTVSCTNSYLNVKTVKVSNGETRTVLDQYIGSSECEEYASSLSAINEVQLSRSIIISTCNSSYLNKTLINTNGESRSISSDYVGSNCKTRALEQNRKILP
ncbi:MAG: hypothetical protein BroJett040_07040 [Oligoflexia bacterium]|nr:MAG: hypothetical protein BroJett040_07040 [Oligoflexia bacterium]